MVPTPMKKLLELCGLELRVAVWTPYFIQNFLCGQLTFFIKFWVEIFGSNSTDNGCLDDLFASLWSSQGSLPWIHLDPSIGFLASLTQMRIIVAQLLRQLLISTIVLFNRRKCWADLPSSLNFCNNSLRRRSCYLLDGNVERFRSKKEQVRCSVVGKKTRTD